MEGVREAADLAQAETESRPAAMESSEPSTEAAQQAPTYAESKVGAADSETIEPVAAPMNGGDAPSAPAAESLDSALVNHLTGYSGVGQRTAESLVEAFGADVFRVMDEEPERVREILPDHRAERVLEERRRELSAGRE